MTGTENTGGRSDKSLRTPGDLTTDGTRLFVADRQNNRVLIWNTLTPTIYQAADAVLGQAASFTTGSNGTSSIKFKLPSAIDILAGKLYLSDASNHRILVWNSVPTITNTPADFVLGQANFAAGASVATAANTFEIPRGLAISLGGALYASDNDANRVSVFNTEPAVSNVNADSVLGQTLFTSNSYFGGLGTSDSLAQPASVDGDGVRVYLADNFHSRVLIWNTGSTAFLQAPDRVLGQPDLTTMNHAISSTTFDRVNAVTSDGTRIAISDPGNHRILVWNSFPTVDGQAADIVLGQPNFTTSSSNNGGLGPASINGPAGVAISAGKLIVTDAGNNRILIWNTWPSSNQQAADVVLGQPDFVSSAINNGGISGASLSSPSKVRTFAGKLFAADVDNNRILLWNSIPTANFTSADAVIGQPTFATSAPFFNSGAVNGQGFLGAGRFYYNGNKLYVEDPGGSRILVWNQLPSPGDSVDLVINAVGAASVFAATTLTIGPTARNMIHPDSPLPIGGDLWIVDRNYDRSLRFPGYGE